MTFEKKVNNKESNTQATFSLHPEQCGRGRENRSGQKEKFVEITSSPPPPTPYPLILARKGFISSSDHLHSSIEG
jgi:hypothetical protein